MENSFGQALIWMRGGKSVRRRGVPGVFHSILFHDFLDKFSDEDVLALDWETVEEQCYSSLTQLTQTVSGHLLSNLGHKVQCSDALWASPPRVGFVCSSCSWIWSISLWDLSLGSHSNSEEAVLCALFSSNRYRQDYAEFLNSGSNQITESLLLKEDSQK